MAPEKGGSGVSPLWAALGALLYVVLIMPLEIIFKLAGDTKKR